MRALGGLLFVCAVVYAAGAAARQPSALAGVLESRTLRCGYIPSAPFIVKDPGTGALSGPIVDYITQSAARRGLGVVWSDIGGFDRIAAALAARTIDAFCLPVTPEAGREKMFSYAADLGGLSYYVWIRADARFSRQDLQMARFAVVHGHALTALTRTFFPRAQTVSLPQTARPDQMFDRIVSREADAHVNDALSAHRYALGHPRSIRRLSPRPLATVKIYLLSRRGDERMRDFLDDAFSVDGPQARARFAGVLRAHRVPEDALVYSAACSQTFVTKERWHLCANAQQ